MRTMKQSLSFPLFSTVLLLGSLVYPVNVSAQDAPVCAETLREIVLQRDFGLAYFCSGVRLQTNANDTEALLVLARSAQELGQWDVAAEFAAQARDHPLSGSEKFASYLISGMAEAGKGRFLLAKLHLRRGSDLAGTEVEKNIITQALRQVRSLSPWSASLGFNITPSSNINGGSLQNTITFFGLEFPLDDDAKAQSGIGYVLSGDVTYQHNFSPHLIWETRLTFNGTAYDGRGRNDLVLGAKTGLRYSPAGARNALWYGYVGYEQRYIGAELGGPAFGEYTPYTNQTNLGLEYHWQSLPGQRFSVYGTYSVQHSEIAVYLDANIARIGGSYDFPITPEVSFFAGGYLEDIDTLSTAAAAQSGNVMMGATWAVAAVPITLSGSLAYTRTDYKRIVFGFSDIRRDDRVTFELGVTPENLQLFGFTPTFGAEFSRGFSNMSRFDTGEIKVFTRINSVF